MVDEKGRFGSRGRWDGGGLRALLEEVRGGDVGVEEALVQLRDLPYETLEIARLDHHRALRRGFPEVICGLGKEPQAVAQLFLHLSRHHEVVLCTLVGEEHAEATREVVEDCVYDPVARLLYKAPAALLDRGRGEVAVVAAGTSDLPVAKEALWTARLMGNRTKLILDVGVAGLHRLLGEMDRIRDAEVLIVVAGMEGALPSVLGGLCDRPIIAVPTSIGYGTGEGGRAAVLSMLNSCVPGITVVNVDNGFGAGYAAALFNRKRDLEDAGTFSLADTEETPKRQL